MGLDEIKVCRRTGEESLHENGRNLAPTMLDFWQWSSSDIFSNATRGVLAEFIIASALGIAQGCVREEWGAFDLLYEGIKIEVKSAAFIQRWWQKDWQLNGQGR